MYRRSSETLGDTSQSKIEGMSLLEGFGIFNVETTNLNMLKSVVPEHIITPLNTSICTYINDQQKLVTIKGEISTAKKDEPNILQNEEIKNIKSNMNEIALHNLKYIIIGGVF